MPAHFQWLSQRKPPKTRKPYTQTDPDTHCGKGRLRRPEHQFLTNSDDEWNRCRTHKNLRREPKVCCDPEMTRFHYCSLVSMEGMRPNTGLIVSPRSEDGHWFFLLRSKKKLCSADKHFLTHWGNRNASRGEAGCYSLMELDQLWYQNVSSSSLWSY